MVLVEKAEALEGLPPNSLVEVIPTAPLKPVSDVSDVSDVSGVSATTTTAATAATAGTTATAATAATAGTVEEAATAGTVEEATEAPARRNLAAPTLTKPGYEITPSLATLNAMDEEALSHVDKVSICVEGVGKVEWEEPVDLRGLDLDALVSIEKVNGCAQIEISQPEGEEDVVEMEPGEGINHKAKLTFYDVFPKETEDAKKFVEFVKRKTESIGGEFVSYDVTTGIWVLRVEHF